MKMIYRINNYLKNLSTIRFIIIIVLLTFLIFIPLSPLFDLYEEYVGEMGGPVDLVSGTLLYTVIVGSILAPLIETLIFQYAVIEKLSSIKILKGKNIVVSIISAALFGISHSYSYLYIFYGFIIGLLLAYAYLIYKKKNFSAFWVVFWIHCIRNTITTILYIIN